MEDLQAAAVLAMPPPSQHPIERQPHAQGRHPEPGTGPPRTVTPHTCDRRSRHAHPADSAAVKPERTHQNCPTRRGRTVTAVAHNA
jgi:hypothetical protein